MMDWFRFIILVGFASCGMSSASMAAGPRVDGDFPGGNSIVDTVNGDTIHVRQDLRDTEGWWFWWNFRVRGAAGRTLRFQFVKPSPIGVRGPAISRDAGKTWAWLGAKSVDGTSFRYAFGPADDKVRFAFAMPYQKADLDRFLQAHRGQVKAGVLAVETLCKSRKGRDVPLIRIRDPKAEANDRVLVTARHHACETMASYVLEGLLGSALSNTGVGKWLRQHVEFVAVPIVDYDGVMDGDQGKNRKPRDHNRDYAGKSIYPETRAIRQLALRWPAGSLNVALDLHCPWIRGPHNEVIYMVGSPLEAVARQQQAFARLLQEKQTGPLAYDMANNIPFGTAWNTAKNYTKGRSFSRWSSALAGVRVGTTFEIPYANASGRSVTPDSARAFGRDLAVALAAYLAQPPTMRSP